MILFSCSLHLQELQSQFKATHSHVEQEMDPVYCAPEFGLGLKMDVLL